MQKRNSLCDALHCCQYRPEHICADDASASLLGIHQYMPYIIKHTMITLHSGAFRCRHAPTHHIYALPATTAVTAAHRKSIQGLERHQKQQQQSFAILAYKLGTWATSICYSIVRRRRSAQDTDLRPCDAAALLVKNILIAEAAGSFLPWGTRIPGSAICKICSSFSSKLYQLCQGSIKESLQYLYVYIPFIQSSYTLSSLVTCLLLLQI